ncbi:hypothetical protein ACQGR7_23730 [Bacillus sp. Gnz1/3]|uniref:hypothetical protein n=1 Tax=Bacillus sp. Gnz1/3 TaxID=3418491 RepID=UPI0038997AE5
MSRTEVSLSRTVFLASLIVLLIGTFTLGPLTANAETNEEVKEDVNLTPEEEARADKLAKSMITIQSISIAIGDEKRNKLLNASKNDENISINISNDELEKVNERLDKQNVALLPDSTKSLDINGDNYIIDTGNENGIQSYGFWGSAWQVTKCAGYLSVAILPASKAYKAVKALGGMRETARLLVGAGSATEFLQITAGVGAEIVGIDGVVNNCQF